MRKVVIKKRLYSLLLTILVLILVIHKVPLVGRWSTVVLSCATYPFLVLYSHTAQPIQRWLTDARDRIALCATIAHLEQTNQRLQAKCIELHATNVYADETADIRRFKERFNLESGVIAQVLSAVCTEYEQTILVNAGSRHGITKNMVALTHNCLVGKVVAVYPWYCKVRLITDARCKVSATCASTGAVGIYHGCNKSDSALLAHLSHLDVVQEGDMLVSTGKGLVFPQGFALGTVVQAAVNGLSYDVVVKPLLSLSDLSYCLLVAKDSCEQHT